MAPRTTSTLRIAGFDLRLDVTVTLELARERPGEQEYSGTTRGQPDARALRSQLVAAGFTMLTDNVALEAYSGPGAGAFALVAHRHATDVTINFSGAPWKVIYVNALDHEAVPEVDVKDGLFTWGGAAWPAFFAAGRITSDTPDAFIVEADVDEGRAAIERYRAWAIERGFELEDPPNAWEDEPDLQLGLVLRFRDARFQVHVSHEDRRLTLFLAPAG
ncbi:MAG: hypothetical protein K8M05_00985 [Deltaproteobacteria bacterium]|nr:hypothetical protein [Kofleriaceae bacterium]